MAAAGVSCSLGCGATAPTVTASKKAGWTQALVTTGLRGGAPPGGGTLHWCPRCWPLVEAAMRGAVDLGQK